MIKKILLDYYYYRINKVINAIIHENRYTSIYGVNDHLNYLSLLLNTRIQILYLEFYKSILPRSWLDE